jgi:hypothetical protein
MEMAFGEHPSTVWCSRQKVHSHGVQELLMTKHAPKRPRALEVQIMFDPNRLAQSALHKAYVSLVPISRRSLPTLARTSEVSVASQVLLEERGAL